MQVFKMTNKLQLKNIGLLVMNLVIFLVMSILIGTIVVPSTADAFSIHKVELGVINEDGETEVTENLFEALEPIIASKKDVENDREKLQDMLFYDDIQYVLIIPKGFSEGLTSGNPIPTKKMVTTEYSSVVVDNMISKFMSSYGAYKNNTGLTDAQIFEKVQADMTKQAELEIGIEVNKDYKLERFNIYCRFAVLMFFSVIAVIIVNGTSIYRSKKLFARTSISPVNNKTMLLQVMLSCVMFVAGVVALWLIVGLIVFGSVIFSARGLLMIANTLVLVLPLTALGILLSALVKSMETMSFIGNIIGLFMGFASGAFIEQSLLSTPLKVAGMMTPGWYFIENIDNITYYTLSSITGKMFINMGIMVGFAIVLLLIVLAINKYRKVDKF